jgi:hypothetical protein
MSSLSAGRLRSGSLNGQALFPGSLSFADSNCDFAAAISTIKTSDCKSDIDRLQCNIRWRRITFSSDYSFIDQYGYQYPAGNGCNYSNKRDCQHFR